MKTIKEKINGMVSVNPPSEYIKVCDLTTPRWIRFTVNFIFLLMLVIILLRLIRSPLYFLLVVGILGAFIPTTFISIYLHEKCHQVIFEMLTGKPAIIRLHPIGSNCRPTAPCPVPAYLAAEIFPLITTASLGVLTSVLFIFNTPQWIIFGFTLTIIHSFL